MIPDALPRLGLGTYPLGGGYGHVDVEQARTVVETAVDLGWTLIDTAESYGSEELLGRVLRGRRDRVFLATKIFPSRRYTFANLRSALTGSLRRLNSDRVDLFQLHAPEDAVRDLTRTPLDELADSLTRLVTTGLTRYVGVCNYPADQIAELARYAPIHTVQDAYSLYDRACEEAVLPATHRLGIAFIAYSPLARGLLADGLPPARLFAPTDFRASLARFQPTVYPTYVRLADRLGRLAAQAGRTLPELALAWVLANPAVACVLVGAKSGRQVELLARAGTWRLSEAEVRQIAKICRSSPVADVPAQRRGVMP